MTSFTPLPQTDRVLPPLLPPIPMEYMEDEILNQKTKHAENIWEQYTSLIMKPQVDKKQLLDVERQYFEFQTDITKQRLKTKWRVSELFFDGFDYGTFPMHNLLQPSLNYAKVPIDKTLNIQKGLQSNILFGYIQTHINSESNILYTIHN